jgi:hypothetical protein
VRPFGAEDCTGCAVGGLHDVFNLISMYDAPRREPQAVSDAPHKGAAARYHEEGNRYSRKARLVKNLALLMIIERGDEILVPPFFPAKTRRITSLRLLRKTLDSVWWQL